MHQDKMRWEEEIRAFKTDKIANFGKALEVILTEQIDTANDSFIKWMKRRKFTRW